MSDAMSQAASDSARTLERAQTKYGHMSEDDRGQEHDRIGAAIIEKRAALRTIEREIDALERDADMLWALWRDSERKAQRSTP